MTRPSAIRRVRHELVEQGPPRERASGDYVEIALPAADANLLVAVLDAEVRSVIEIGLAYASSALAIAESLVTHGSGNWRHVIVEPYQSLFDHVGVELLTDAGLEGRYELIEEESQIALPRLAADGELFDAAFVDGSHKFHNVFVDLYYLQRLVAPGGLVVLDDCGWEPVATAVDYFVENLAWRRTGLPERTRLTAYRLPQSPADPPFHEFRPFGTGRDGFLPPRPRDVRPE